MPLSIHGIHIIHARLRHVCCHLPGAFYFSFNGFKGALSAQCGWVANATFLACSLNFQCTLVEGFNPYKRLFTKKNSYLQKKRLLFAKKKDPYLQKKDPYLKKKDPYFWSYINSIFDFLNIFQKIISDFFVFKPLTFLLGWRYFLFLFVLPPFHPLPF